MVSAIAALCASSPSSAAILRVLLQTLYVCSSFNTMFCWSCVSRVAWSFTKRENQERYRATVSAFMVGEHMYHSSAPDRKGKGGKDGMQFPDKRIDNFPAPR